MASAPKLGGGTVTLDSCFETEFNMPLVHETVRAELNARRQGTSATKTRGLVSGGGAKPWRQKGTGRARQGSTRAPHFAGGGTVFGPQPRSYVVKVNRKARQAALRSAISEHAKRGSLAVFDAATFDAPSARKAADLLTGWGQGYSACVLLSAHEEFAGKSFRNLKRAEPIPVGEAGVADILRHGSLLISESALDELTARATAHVRGKGANS